MSCNRGIYRTPKNMPNSSKTCVQILQTCKELFEVGIRYKLLKKLPTWGRFRQSILVEGMKRKASILKQALRSLFKSRQSWGHALDDNPMGRLASSPRPDRGDSCPEVGTCLWAMGRWAAWTFLPRQTRWSVDTTRVARPAHYCLAHVFMDTQ